MSDLQYFKDRYNEMVNENANLTQKLEQAKEILEAKNNAIKTYSKIESRLNKECHFLALEKQQLKKALELSINDLSMDDCPYSYDRFNGFIDQFTGQNMCEHCVESVTSDENLIKDCYLKYYMEQAK